MKITLYAIRLWKKEEFFWNENEQMYTKTSFSTWTTQQEASDVLHKLYTDEDAVGKVVKLTITVA